MAGKLISGNLRSKRFPGSLLNILCFRILAKNRQITQNHPIIWGLIENQEQNMLLRAGDCCGLDRILVVLSSFVNWKLGPQYGSKSW